MEYLLAFTGLIIFVLLNIVKTIKTHGDHFDIKIWLADNQWTIYLSIASTFGLMLALQDVINFIDQKVDYAKLVSLFIGFSNYGLFKLIMDSLFRKAKKVK